MTGSRMIGGMLVLGLAVEFQTANAQAPEASAPDERSRTTQVDRQQAKPEFKVVFWYERADPSASLKSKVYDLRRGRYDQGAVEGWLKKVKADFPAYVAFERDIDLEGKPGGTEEEKLAAAIEREREQIVGAEAKEEAHRRNQPSQPPQAHRAQDQARSQPAYRPLDLSNLLHPGGTPSVRSFTSGNGFGPSTFGAAPGGGRSSLSPPSPPFPHPYPYPRPHP